MDILTFIAEIFKALIWPLAVGILLYYLRGPIEDLIPLLTRLKYKDIELEFGRKIEEVKVESIKEYGDEKLELQEQDSIIIKLADISPRSAVLEAWRSVESEIIATADRVMTKKGRRLAIILPHVGLKILRDENIIDENEHEILNTLRQLRNQAAHAPDFALSRWMVFEYLEITKRIDNKLKSIGGV
jgi:DNA-directed RNA polymerase subunit F